MSARELNQFAVVVLVLWAAAWGAVYWISAGRAARAHEAIYWMSASRAASARAAAAAARSCSGGGPCLGRPYDAAVRRYLVMHGVSANLQADQDAYLREFGAEQTKARAWMDRSAWWGAGGAILISLSAFAGPRIWRGFRARRG